MTVPALSAAYVVQSCAGGDLYKGACRDLVARMEAHRAGHVSRTKGQRPLRLVYYELCDDYRSALKRETFLKSGVGRRLLKEQLAAPQDDILPGWLPVCLRQRIGRRSRLPA